MILFLQSVTMDISSFPMVQTGSLNDISGSVCPDNSPCPSEYSCLLTPTGVYGCCPFPQGLSCADGKHCCPDGYKCSDDGSSCTRHTEVSIVGAVICPDKESECPDETTCCELPDGSWGCCPMVKAVCCDDKVHCCPEGTRCDIAHSKCLSHESETPMWGKLLARKRAAWENNKVICPDMQTKCPSDTTCCEMPSGSYGCCPMPQAVCCDDHEHCCPEDTTCDLAAGTCDQGGFSVPWLKKVPALVSEPNEEKCDDQYSCPDGSTCCKLSTGDWACCPLPHVRHAYK
ncbi:Granulin [Acipenser ruthenus]|uniref:Granulin n=1 Tax=Acipenser ruthenus TaxID=7906 RepID=A0A662YUE7_ACIRT|nr:Granulin [Acipenser ruthenus]